MSGAQMVPTAPNLLPPLGNDLSQWLSEGLADTEATFYLEEGNTTSVGFFNHTYTMWTDAPDFGTKKGDLDGLNCNGTPPTRTTQTYTPTTLQQIHEDDFLVLPDEEHERRAHFEPPPITPSPFTSVTQANGSNSIHIADQASWHGGHVISDQPSVTPTPQLVSALTPRSSTPGSRCDTPPQTQPTRRNVGGRRPNKEKGISPEEEERRQVRRERNKLAAARCRKRRIDHTNQLLEQTEGLEEKKNNIQAEIAELQAQKDELEMILAAHTPCCKLNKSNSPSPNFLQQDKVSFAEQDKISLNNVTIRIKQEPDCIPTSESSLVHPNKRVALGNSNRPRPTSLPVSTSPFMSLPKHQSESKTNPSVASSLLEMANIPISTPSSGMHLNFDSLMNGGTGLTPQGPLAPTCSSQQRGDLPTPENGNNKRMLSL